MNNQHVDDAISEALEPTSTELEDDEFELDEADPKELGEPEGENLEAFKARYFPFHLYVHTHNISRRWLHSWLYDSLQ